MRVSRNSRMDPNEKKIFEFEQEKKLREALEKEEERSDKTYAIKLTERVVFGIIALMGMTVSGVLIKVALDYIKNFIEK